MKRYDKFFEVKDGVATCEMRESPTGHYVEFADCEKLHRKNHELLAVMEAILVAIRLLDARGKLIKPKIFLDKINEEFKRLDIKLQVRGH